MTNSFNNLESLEQGMAGKTFRLAGISQLDGYEVRKIYTGETTVPSDWIKEQFPRAEVVEDRNAIINDHNIDLVLVADPENQDLDTVAQLLQTGKFVRMV